MDDSTGDRLVMLMATPAFAKSITLKTRVCSVDLHYYWRRDRTPPIDSGSHSLLLFHWTTSFVVFKGKKKEEEVAEMTPGLKAAPVKK